MARELESASVKTAYRDAGYLAGLANAELEQESIRRMVACEEAGREYRDDAALQRSGWELARRRGEVE